MALTSYILYMTDIECPNCYCTMIEHCATNKIYSPYASCTESWVYFCPNCETIKEPIIEDLIEEIYEPNFNF